MQIPFFQPGMTGEEVDAAACTVAGMWLSTGPKVAEFESMITSFCGADNAVCLNSCTAALGIALRILGIGHGDEVIVPAYTYTATAAAVIHAGAVPVMVDSRADGFHIDTLALAEAVTPRTKGVIPVDIGGEICDYDGILKVCEDKSDLMNFSSDMLRKLGRIAVIADSAHGFGGRRREGMSGTLADLTCFSFHSVKNITTADGGAIVWRGLPCDSDRLKRYVKMLACHGQTRDSFAKSASASIDYDIEEIGFKCNMNDMAASIGVSQLKRYDAILRRRREIIRYYDERFANLPISGLCHFGEDSESSAHLYMTLLDPELANHRDNVLCRMWDKGIQCNIHFKPLPLMTAYHRLGFDINRFPNAYNSYRREITLPLYPSLTDAEVEYIADCFSDIVGSL